MTAIDLEMMRRYDVRAPRYTSYPTALHFDQTVDAFAVESDMGASAGSERPISLYVHVPYCRSLCWYCACSRVVTRDPSRGDQYLDRLFREFDLAAPSLSGRPAVQLHLGGGTPTFLSADQLRRLSLGVRERFAVSRDAEWSIEVDPRTFSDAQLEALADSGFKRASLGVQDNDPDVQRAIHRDQPWEVTRRVLESIRGRGFESTNFDLIYGLPLQTLDTFSKTIDDVLEVRPDRLAIYSYAHVPWSQPQQVLLEKYPRPSGDEKLGLLKMSIERLSNAGYVYIGMDHFALPNDSLAVALGDGTLRRNFQGYSTQSGVDIHAFGPTAISQTEHLYFQNEKDLSAWEAAIDRGMRPTCRGVRLNDDDQIRRAMIMEIMCRTVVDFGAFETTWRVDPRVYFANELSRLTPFVEDGLLEERVDGIRITTRGRMFLRNIALEFDARISHETSRYSKAI